jgi:hypothetical protein
MAVQCPKCGFEQEGGVECNRCGVIFARASQPQRQPPDPVQAPVVDKGQSISVLGTVYRRVRWIILAGLLLVFALILRQDTPPVVDEDPRAGESLQLKLRNLQQPSTGARSQSLRLNEAEINTWVKSNLALAPENPPQDTSPQGTPTVEEVQSNVRNVMIVLLDDRLRAYVVFNLYGKDLSLTLEGRLRVENGYLRFAPIAAKLGSLPLPQATIDRAVERLFESPENLEQFRLPPEIADLRVENSELVLSYR